MKGELPNERKQNQNTWNDIQQFSGENHWRSGVQIIGRLVKPKYAHVKNMNV